MNDDESAEGTACSNLGDDESAFETKFYLEFLLLTEEVCTYVCMYILIIDVKEQLADDGIKRYQGTN